MIHWKKILLSCAAVGACLLAIPVTVFAVKSISSSQEPAPPLPPETVMISAVRISAEAPREGAAPCTIAADGSDYKIESVSYTHLDVYKRQIQLPSVIEFSYSSDNVTWTKVHTGKFPTDLNTSTAYTCLLYTSRCV